MPHFERPNSPADQTSDQYAVHRTEHDLLELFEEQQLLMDIVTQQQKRLRQQLEIQSILLNAPAARAATPLPELLQPEALPDQATVKQSVPEHMKASAASSLYTLAEEESQRQSELVSSLATKRRDCGSANCSSHKLNGLGFDPPFPYPKHMSKSYEHRSLYIFTLVDSLVLQLQFSMDLIKTDPATRAAYNSLGQSTTSTGALAKLRLKDGVSPAKQAAKPKASKRLHDQMGETPLLNHELDLDCELGMEHIEKFRANRVREYEYTRLDHSRMSLPAQRININGDRELALSSGSDDELKAICQDAGTSAICFYSGVPGGELRPSSPATLQSSCYLNPLPSTSAQAQAVLQHVRYPRSPSPLTQLMADLPPLSASPQCPIYPITCEQMGLDSAQINFLCNDQTVFMNLLDFATQPEIDYDLDSKQETDDAAIPPPPPPPPPPTPEHELSSQLANLPNDSANALLNNMNFDCFNF